MNLRGFITHKLEEQAEFVRWWKETVGVRQSPGNNQHSSNADLRSTIPKDDAESITGITQQQVSKWAKKLQKPDQYRAQLFGAAYKAAMMSKEDVDGDQGRIAPRPVLALDRGGI